MPPVLTPSASRPVVTELTGDERITRRPEIMGTRPQLMTLPPAIGAVVDPHDGQADQPNALRKVPTVICGHPRLTKTPGGTFKIGKSNTTICAY